MLLKKLLIIFLLLSLTGLASAEETSDQVAINQAIDEAYNMGGGIVEIDGYFEITGPIIMKPNVHLKGLSGTIVKVSPDSDQWFIDGIGLIDNEGNPDGVKVSGFTIDGNIWAFPTSWANSGKGDHNAERAIDLRGSSNDFAEDISIHDMNIINCYSDGIHITFAENVEIYDNLVSNCQHSAIYLVSVTGSEIKSNDVEGITSDSIRIDNGEDNSVYNNHLTTFKGDSNGAYQGGQNAIQIADQGYSHGGGSDKPTSTNNIRVYNNTIDGEGLRDIWIDSTGKGVKDVYVYDNIIEDGGKEPTTTKSVKNSDVIKVNGYDSDAINDAIESASEGDTVQLEAEEYLINKQITVKDGITLKGVMNGDSWGTTLKLMDNAPTSEFGNQDPIIVAHNDFTMCDIHLDMNSENQDKVPVVDGKKMGTGHHNGIGISGGNNIKIYNCWIDNGLGDHIRLRSCTDVDIHDNKITRAGHEGIFLIMCEMAKVHDNYIEPRDNTGVRLWGGHSIRIYDNTITFSRTDFEGNTQTSCHAFQVQMDDDKLMSDIEICGNYVYGVLVSGSWFVDKTGESTEDPIRVHHNVFEDCGDGVGWGAAGIIINGLNARIENNVFDGCQGAGVSVQSYNGAWGTDAEVSISDNIFTNTQEWEHAGTGGYAIDNSISADITTQDNCFYANEKGNTQGCRLSGSDCFVNPKTSQTACDITWDGNSWNIPGVKPQGFSGETGVYDNVEPVTDEEIDEFDSIFDLLGMTFYDIAGLSYSIILPEGITEIPTNGTWTIEQHNNSALVYGPESGLTSVICKYDGKEGIHTIMIGERSGWQMVYSNVSIWKGEISRSGDSFMLDGKVNPDKLQITCYTPKGSFEPSYEVIEVKDNPVMFDYWIIIYLTITGILLCVPLAVIFIIFRK